MCSFFLPYRKLWPLKFFCHVSIPLLFRVLRDLIYLCKTSRARVKGWWSHGVKVGLPAFQEVLVPSSGSWRMFRKNSGYFRGIWKPAQETIQSLPHKLQFVNQIILLTSSNLIALFISFVWIVAWNLLKEREWFKNMKLCFHCWKGKQLLGLYCSASCISPPMPLAVVCLSRFLSGCEVLLCILCYNHIICEHSASGLQTQVSR